VVCFSGNKCPGWPSEEAREGLAKSIEELESKWLPRYAGAFERQLGQSSSGFLVGSRICIADTTLLRYTEELSDWLGEAQTAKMLAPWPKLTAWRAKVKAEPNVAAFLKSAHRMPSPADKATGDTYYKEVMTSLGWA